MLIFAFMGSFAEPLHCLFIIGILIFAAIFSKVLLKESKDAVALILAAVLGLSVVAANLFFVHEPAKALDGLTADIEGVVTEVSVTGGNPVFTVKTEKIDIDGAPQKIKIRLSGWDENAAEAFDKIACKVSFISHENENFGTILTDRSAGTAVYAFTKEPIEVIGSDRSSFGYFIHLIREKAAYAIASNFIGWHAPFMERILLGGGKDLDYEVIAAFRQSGMSHILAISGMHMVIIIGLIERIIGFRRTEGKLKKAEIIVLAAAVFVYMFVGGFGMSLRRAGIMLVFGYLVRFFLYDSHTADNLGLAVSAILLFDPFAACDVGFLMSAASCLSISVFSPVLKKGIAKIFKINNEKSVLGFFAEAFSVSISAFLAVLPISSAVFGEVYPAGILSNALTPVLVPAIIVLGMLAVIFGNIPFLGFAAEGCAFICMVLNGFLFKIAEIFSFGGKLFFETDKGWMLVLIFGCAVLIILPALLSNSLKYVPFSLAVSFFVICGGVFIDSALFSGVPEVRITALEHGTAVSCRIGENSVLITRGLEASDIYDDIFYKKHDAFISLEPAFGGEELVAAERVSPEFALFGDEDSVERFKNSGLAKEGVLVFSEGCSVEIISDGIFTVDAKEISLLYISEECDIIEDIKPQFRRADIVVLDGVSPDMFPEIGCEYLILRDHYGFYGRSAEVFDLEKGDLVFFGYRGKIRKGWLTG